MQALRRMNEKDLARFLAKVEQTESCWLWTGSIAGGYGKMWYDGMPRLAHRIGYTYWVGPVPEDMQLDHLCRVRHCVNPDHLEPVTHQENMRRGMSGWQNRVKTHCSKGHPYDEENTYQTPNNGRACRACHRQWTSEYRKRQSV